MKVVAKQEIQTLLRAKVKQVIVPAGKYWLCDPCYAVPENLWMQLLNSCDFFNAPVGTVTDSRGGVHHVLGFCTAYGDGCYVDQHGNTYPVDAGLIGLVPVELGEPGGFGTLVEFKTDTICINHSGKMQFGGYKINTRDDEDFDDEEDDE